MFYGIRHCDSTNNGFLSYNVQFSQLLKNFCLGIPFFLTLTKDGTNNLLYAGIEPRKLAERNLRWPAGTAIGPSADFWSYLKSSLEAFLSRVVFPHLVVCPWMVRIHPKIGLSRLWWDLLGLCSASKTGSADNFWELSRMKMSQKTKGSLFPVAFRPRPSQR